ncbi:MAG: NADH-quinone oxidoreductase subunit NuoH [Bacteroides sp.]|nr:MAG: NADH-quinone oxidoreductase subunit NuoH [Bacteroides sp.]
MIEKILLIIIVLAITLLIAMYTTLAERKIAGFMQDRIGPNRAGPYGLLQPIMDGIKLLTKEEIIPFYSNKILFVIAPALYMFLALMNSAVIPWGGTLKINNYLIKLQISDINIGILYIFSIISLNIYGIILSGWSSNNKYSLLSSIRGASQNISYEISMNIVLITLIMSTNTMSIKEIVLQQNSLNWNIFYQPIGFLIFLICSFAETNRNPFDLVECETELIAGFHTEYSSMKLGLFLFAEYINIFISSTVISCLYLGGYNYFGMNLLHHLGVHNNIIVIIGIMSLFIKIFFLIFFFIWVRWTLPRFRYDQLIYLGWNILIPLAMLNMIITGGLILFFK